MPPTSVQIFGTRKCADTRKAERWFKERRIAVSLIYLNERGLSPGELRSVAARTTLEALIDREGARYRDRGLRAAAPTGPRVETALLDDPLLLRTPIVRAGKQASVGYTPEMWEGWT
jgi:arsenate reductase